MDLLQIEHNSPTYRKAVELRRQVLRIPLGLDFTDAQLAHEAADFHLAAMDDDDVIACLILVDTRSGMVKMRQVAVSPHLQRSGAGTRLVAFSEAFAIERGFERMILHARETAVPFYQKLGYAIDGDAFEEMGIPHFEMSKPLS